MTIHTRSKINSVIDYTDYFAINGVAGCCCKADGTLTPTTFLECNSDGGQYIIPEQGQDCSNVICPEAGRTGCCCACKYLTPAQRDLVERDILGATYGMVDGVGQCDCEDMGGKWSPGPCDITNPIYHCRKSNGVDVRIPKACCGVTFQRLEIQGVTRIAPVAFCEDVCSPKECSDNTILNYAATYYSNGRRCFYQNNAGPAVASFDCRLVESEGATGTIVAPLAPSNYPVCNNSNFYCWGNNCQYYVNLINNGIYTTPAVNDYNVLVSSGAAQKLSDFNDIDEGKNIIGNGVFQSYTKNYSYIKARYGKAAFITLDNKALFHGMQSLGFQNGVEYLPANYSTTPFFKYDRVEIGKNFVILRKQSNIGTRAEFYGYLTPGVVLSQDKLNESGIESVHALEEAACITRLNFLTNNVELYCQGYPFPTDILTKIDGGVSIEGGITYNYTIVPESVSCNGFHCTYKRRKLNQNRTVLKTEWVTKGEYKRSRTIQGNLIEVSERRLIKQLTNPQTQFINGIVVAGQNFDCFLEGVVQNQETGAGYTNLSCVGVWDPSDTNKIFYEIDNHEFGIVYEIPGPGGMYADCDYNKCFAVSPILEYCEQNILGFCCRQAPCGCLNNVTRESCNQLNGTYYSGNDEYTCSDCINSCGFACGTTLQEENESPRYVRWYEVEATSATIQIDPINNKKYIEITLQYSTYGQEDRIVILAKHSTDPVSNSILKSPVSLVYGPNGGPQSDGYTAYLPFNTPYAGSPEIGPHPYLSYNSNPLTQCPSDGIIFDTGCVSIIDGSRVVRIYEDQINLNSDVELDYKVFRIVVFGGCQGNAPTNWNIGLSCS